MRFCNICKQEKNEDEFYIYKDGNKRNVCKECNRKLQKHSRTVLKNQNPDYYRKRSYIYKENFKKRNPKRAWCITTRDNHKRRGFDVKFTTEELFQKIKDVSNCYYCGSKLIFEKDDNKSLCNRPTLDRINNEKEMTLENVRVICNCCNAGKAQMTHEQFILYCKSIASRF